MGAGVGEANGIRYCNCDGSSGYKDSRYDWATLVSFETVEEATVAGGR